MTKKYIGLILGRYSRCGDFNFYSPSMKIYYVENRICYQSVVFDEIPVMPNLYNKTFTMDTSYARVAFDLIIAKRHSCLTVITNHAEIIKYLMTEELLK